MLANKIPVVSAEWPAPAHVCAFTTTRIGGVSAAPYGSLNLGMNTGDFRSSVTENRRRLSLQLPREPVWLQQVHGVDVYCVDQTETGVPQADASFTSSPQRVCAVLTADCLPVFLCDRLGQTVGIAHAGWRGLCSGIIEAIVQKMPCAPSTLMAWLGPAISAAAFEVGPEVREAFSASMALPSNAFIAISKGRWRADLYAIARQRLAFAGVPAVFWSRCCTFSEPSQFFSYRRDGPTGRMASVIYRALL